MKICRRTAVTALLSFGLATPGTSTSQSPQNSGHTMSQPESAIPGVHDFDFLIGRWRVHHRRLKERLANNHEWVEFEGTLAAQQLMDGSANVDDNVFELPGGISRGVALRSFDAKSQQWAIWWLDGSTPLGPLDPPVRGSFHDGVGTFYADDTFKQKPVRIRFTWSHITPTSCHWEQAFSPDAGKSWETNWVMDFKRER